MGDTYEEAINNAREAIQCHIEGVLQDGEPVPREPGLDLLAEEGGEVVVTAPVMA